ncbi:MAG: hypothetical protein R6V76_05005 [Desulfobacterales bacterium]
MYRNFKALTFMSDTSIIKDEWFGWILTVFKSFRKQRGMLSLFRLNYNLLNIIDKLEGYGIHTGIVHATWCFSHDNLKMRLCE